MPETFGNRIDFAQLIKQYGTEGVEAQRRYSPPTVIGTDYQEIIGQPSLKETPAMASGLENPVWSIRELIDESAKF